MLFKKIIMIFISLEKFYKDRISQIVFIAIVLSLIVSIRKLPYFNIVPNYNDFSIILVVVLILIMLRKKLSTKRIFVIIEFIILFALILELFLMNNILEFLGFLIFSLVLLSITAGFINDRKTFKDF